MTEEKIKEIIKEFEINPVTEKEVAIAQDYIVSTSNRISMPVEEYKLLLFNTIRQNRVNAEFINDMKSVCDNVIEMKDINGKVAIIKHEDDRDWIDICGDQADLEREDPNYWDSVR